MRICVCGAQVPFVSGGAELHMQNLVKAFTEAGHDAELVRIPTAWDAERALEAAFAWRLVPIDADLVVATNFPAYFVRHPRKVVWLFHQHRAAYDGADTEWSDYGLDARSHELQRTLVDWDIRVLREAERRYATSGVVADRLLRYNGLGAKPLYHPPPLADRLHAATSEDYVFCPTRLAANKRPDLLVRAMADVQGGTRARIAGSGDLEPDLRGLVDDLGLEGKVELLGFVPDLTLIEEYARCLAVVYAPFDEDYGYVTLQAFLASKPVITSKDSGGVLEWVEDGKTGIVTDGSPEQIGAAIDELAGQPDLARRMGAAGRDSVKKLDWASVVQELLYGTAPGGGS